MAGKNDKDVELNGPDNRLSTVPKRKPVPGVAAQAESPEENRAYPQEGNPAGSSAPAPPPKGTEKKPARRVGGIAVPIPLAGNRKKQLILGGLVLAAVLALVIGLAVGLSLRKKSSNLPLPTSHGGTFSGDMTYYDPGLGSCGITSSSSEAICAVSHIIFDAAGKGGSNPNANPLCGLKIRIRKDGKSKDVTVVDRCVGCKAADLDVSESVFSDLASAVDGRVTVEWAWLDDVPASVSSS